jgi:hypothetical protein
MKINLNEIDRTNFIVAEHEFCGEKVWLVIPQHIGCSWTKDTMHFRSSVYNADGELISASFPKFFNWGEHPELTPLPKSLDGATLMEKLDGSTLIVSKYKGNFMIRTRGTIDASKMEKNGWEVEFLMEKYPEIKNKAKSQDTWNYSLIFEWISPNNQIVINYTEPDIRLIGCICHDDYRLVTQSSLETLAKDLGIGRPQSFKFDTIEEMTTAIEALKNQEGIVVYFNNEQSLLKVKGAWYLALHRMKSELSSIDGVVDLYFSLGGNLSYDEFMKHITDVFDWELAKMVMGSVSKIVDSRKEVDRIVAHMESFVEPLKSGIRKDAALAIVKAYGETNRASFAFKLLDCKKLEEKEMKKLIFQCIR